jgi:radical SAM protein with 4Fe4S-binding SPASM domain
MTLSMAESLIDECFRTGERVALLGGEPTEYPEFIELLEYVAKKKHLNQKSPEFLLISNFLFGDEKVGKALKEFQEAHEKYMGFLLNVAEMSKTQLALFLKNVEMFVLPSSKLSPGITLNKNLEASYYINNLKPIIDTGKVKNIRLSVPNPLPGSISFDEYYEEEMPVYRQQSYDLIKWGLSELIEVSFDCGTTECFFEEPLTLDFVNRFTAKRENKLGCSAGALDIKPTGDLMPCYPGSHITTNIHDYDTLKEAESKVLYLKRYYETKAPPKKCLNCEKFLTSCHGPCVGFYGEENEIN